MHLLSDLPDGTFTAKVEVQNPTLPHPTMTLDVIGSDEYYKVSVPQNIRPIMEQLHNTTAEFVKTSGKKKSFLVVLPSSTQIKDAAHRWKEPQSGTFLENVQFSASSFKQTIVKYKLNDEEHIMARDEFKRKFVKHEEQWYDVSKKPVLCHMTPKNPNSTEPMVTKVLSPLEGKLAAARYILAPVKKSEVDALIYTPESDSDESN